MSFKKLPAPTNDTKAPEALAAHAGRTIQVAIGVLIDDSSSQRRLLVARRKGDTVLGGFWEFPGGKIESGETAEQCVVREFAEELGLTVAVAQPLPVLEHTYAHGHVRLQPFICRLVSGSAVNLGVAEHRWIAPGKLRQFTFPPANGPLIERLLAGNIEQNESDGCTSVAGAIRRRP